MHKALAFALSLLAVPPASSSAVVVDVRGFRSASGRTICQLFSRDAGFPEAGADVVVEASIEQVRSADGTAVLVSRCEFVGVVAGTWAVSVLHDEDGNKKMAKNAVGAPAEGYAVSNNVTHWFSAPTWREAAFPVRASETQPTLVSVSLHY